MAKKMRPQGIQFGIVCLVFGTAAAITDVVAYFNDRVFTTIMGLTPMLLLSGIVFLIVPGNNPPAEVPDKERPKMWWKTSSTMNKLVWIVTALAGIAIGLTLVFTYTDFAD